jgi:hypothetical protein
VSAGGSTRTIGESRHSALSLVGSGVMLRLRGGTLLYADVARAPALDLSGKAHVLVLPWGVIGGHPVSIAVDVIERVDIPAIGSHRAYAQICREQRAQWRGDEPRVPTEEDGR